MTDRNDNRLLNEIESPDYHERSQAAALLDRIRQSPTPSYAGSTNSDPGRYYTERNYDDPRKPANAANLSPIREHPHERQSRQKRHSHKRRSSHDRNSNSRGSRLNSSLSNRPHDRQSYPMHSRTPSNDSYEGGADSFSSVDSIKVLPPAPYLDDDSEDEYRDVPYPGDHLGVADGEDGTYRDWV